MRFHKLGEIRFEPFGHGQKEGPALRGIGYLKEPYIHYNFSKGLSDWFAKHVGYARREVLLRLENEKRGAAPIVGNDKIARHRRVKRFAAKLPFKPVLKFFYIYIFNLGFLDGKAGFRFALMQMWYQFVIETIYRDLRNGSK